MNLRCVNPPRSPSKDLNPLQTPTYSIRMILERTWAARPCEANDRASRQHQMLRPRLLTYAPRSGGGHRSQRTLRSPLQCPHHLNHIPKLSPWSQHEVLLNRNHFRVLNVRAKGDLLHIHVLDGGILADVQIQVCRWKQFSDYVQVDCGGKSEGNTSRNHQ